MSAIEFLGNPEAWARLVGIVVIDLTLAGDNALVIALAVRRLPRRQRLWGRIWGTVGAVALRLMFIAVATLLLRIPLLQLAGGLLLVWIAVKLLRQPAAVHGDTREGASLSDAIWTIIVADAAMSLDNVVAVAGAAGGDFRLLLFGIGLSLPLVVWGSGLLARLMDRFPAIIWVGGGILGYVAGEMILRDLAVERWLGGAPGPVQLLPIGLGVLLALLGWGWSGRVTAENRDRA